ncbi:MAG: phytoene/squalene synthase family protein [Flavobacteriaceae bacterium]|tara:strand:- start:1135 stop:1974 length:840 start_codon:yes stop_codon:yes gene_type:complete
MIKLFNDISQEFSKLVTIRYSTSFSLATKTLNSSIRNHIYNIYGFVRFADEIVDTFHEFPKKELLENFENNLFMALKNKISLNPILNSFQLTVNKFDIDYSLIQSFLKSMKWDLNKKKCKSQKEFKEYIYGSADVVGLMCLKVFVSGNPKKYKELVPSAMALGSAFQKVNFLRDLKDDYENLNRSYFPNIDFTNFSEESKKNIINEIKKDFDLALNGIKKLPNSSRLGVYTAYKYYLKLLHKLENTPSLKIKSTRIRIPNYQKINLLLYSYFKHQFKFI